MVLGNATQKIQTIVDLAEEVYEKVTVLREEIDALRGTVEETNDRVVALEAELDAQRALLERIAAANDVDVEAVLAEASAGDEESTGDEESDGAE